MRSSAVIALLLLLTLASGAHGAPSRPPSMLVILTPGMTLDDWLSIPIIRRMMGEGAIAVMNTRTARMPDDKHREPPDAAVLTLSAGARAAWPAPASVTPPLWDQIEAANRNLGYDIHLGNLADALESRGIGLKTDNYSGSGEGALLATNGQGEIATVGPEPIFYHPGCLVAELGHDIQISDLSEYTDSAKASGQRILLISPFVNDRAYARDDRLAPVLMWGDGVPHGLLYSPSTRTAGLITNTDIAPTIAAYFGATLPTPAVGRAVNVQANADPIVEIASVRQRALAQRSAQKVLPYLAILLGICLSGLAAIHWKQQERATARETTAGRMISTCLSVVVIVLLLASSSHDLIVWMTMALFLTLATAERPLTGRLIEPFRLAIMTVFAATLLGDAALDGRILRDSVLGYSPIEGARYYGIGNEAMGALSGAMLITLSAAWTCRRLRCAVIAAMITVVAIVGAPSMGAKAGGVIVLTGAFAVFLMAGYGQRVGVRGLLIATALGLLALASMAVLDSAHSSSTQSHMGAAIALIRHGGAGQAVDIIARKMAVELKLATHSAWALPVWAGFACLIIQRRKSTSADVPLARRALLDSTLVAAILMLLFNDAGAVACALCLSLVCSYVALDGLTRRNDGMPTSPSPSA